MSYTEPLGRELLLNRALVGTESDLLIVFPFLRFLGILKLEDTVCEEFVLSKLDAMMSSFGIVDEDHKMDILMRTDRLFLVRFPLTQSCFTSRPRVFSFEITVLDENELKITNSFGMKKASVLTSSIFFLKNCFPTPTYLDPPKKYLFPSKSMLCTQSVPDSNPRTYNLYYLRSVPFFFSCGPASGTQSLFKAGLQNKSRRTIVRWRGR